MSIAEIDRSEMSGARLNDLVGHLEATDEGFANWIIFRSELLKVLLELRRHRTGTTTTEEPSD